MVGIGVVVAIAVAVAVVVGIGVVVVVAIAVGVAVVVGVAIGVVVAIAVGVVVGIGVGGKMTTEQQPSTILKHSKAQRVVFFYPGEEGTYVDNPMVTLFENGIVHIRADEEEATTHLHHCEILWRYLDKKKPNTTPFKPRIVPKD